MLRYMHSVAQKMDTFEIDANEPPPLHPNVTLILFDWDDTLFCTSYLSRCRKKNRYLCLQNSFQRLEEEVIAILCSSVSLGHTVIVTNAGMEWVEHCLTEFMPDVGANLISMKIPVISARARFQDQAPNDPILWKQRAFAELHCKFSKLSNIIAIGDQEAEMCALLTLAKKCETPFAKIIWMRAHPTFYELCKQLSCLRKKLPSIVHRAAALKCTLQPVIV